MMGLEENLRMIIRERLKDKSFEVTNVFFIRDNSMRVYFRKVRE